VEIEEQYQADLKQVCTFGKLGQ